MASRLTRGSKRARWTLPLVGVICVLGLLVGGVVAVWEPQPAFAADPNTLYINTNNAGKTGSCVAGNDSYSVITSANTCSLGAALTQANTSPVPLRVTLATEFAASIPEGTQAMITPDYSNTTWMNTTFQGFAGTGALYAITAPMVVDLHNKLGIRAINAGPASILINGSDIAVLNASEIRAVTAAILVGPAANTVRIDGGQTMPMEGYRINRFLEIQNGAQGITFQNYTVGNLIDPLAIENSAAVFFATPGAGTSTTIVVNDVTFTTTRDPNSSQWICTDLDSSGCVNAAISLGSGSRVDGLEIKNSRFQNLRAPVQANRPVIFGASRQGTTANLANLDFHDNSIVNSTTCPNPSGMSCALILLPTSGVDGTTDNYIRGNHFVNFPGYSQPHAIAWISNKTTNFNTTRSGLFIQDNHFDGFIGSTIPLGNAGVVSVERNEFGVNSYSNANTIDEETAAVLTGQTSETISKAMIMNGNADYASNRKILTWYPTALTTIAPGCRFVVDAISPTHLDPNRVPTQPVRLEVYWTSTTKAERYLGSSVVDAGTTASLKLDLPDEAIGPDGTVAGNIRLLTQSLAFGQPMTSQHSRTLPLSGSCFRVALDTLAQDLGPIQGGGQVSITGLGLSQVDEVVVVFNEDSACTALVIHDDTSATCTAPASTRAGSRTGVVALTVSQSVAGEVLASVETTYLYIAHGELTVVKRGWIDLPDLGSGVTGEALHDLLVGGSSGAVEVAWGSPLPSGTTVTWTYTLTYIYRVGAAPYGGAGDTALTGVVIEDDKLGEVCGIEILHLNTPIGCTASGALER